jgi:3D (Asp-Asp-Asp) domain-containing protein
VNDSIEAGKGLKSSGFALGPIIAALVLTACSSAHADQNKSSLLIHKDQRYIIKAEAVRIVTAYNAGDPRQTDDTPCISANGENLCKALAAGKKRCAANFVPLGSRLHVDKVGVCLVTDRTNKRYGNRVDIAMHRHELHKARQFGRQKLKVRIIEPAPDKENPASKL